VAAVAAIVAANKEDASADDLTKAVIKRRVKNVNVYNSFMHMLAYYVHVAHPGAIGASASERLRNGLATVHEKLSTLTVVPDEFDSVEEFIREYYEATFAYYLLVVPTAIKNGQYDITRHIMPLTAEDLRWYELAMATLVAVEGRSPSQNKRLYCLSQVISTTKALLQLEAKAETNALSARLAALEAKSSASQGKPAKTKTTAKPKVAAASPKTYDCRLLMALSVSPIIVDKNGSTLVLDNNVKPAKWCPTVAFHLTNGWADTPPEVKGKTSACNCKLEYGNRPMAKRDGTLTDTSGKTSRVTATGCVTLAGNMFVHSV